MDLILFVAITSLASLFQSIAGFGFALIAAPLTLIFLDKELAITSIIISSIFMNMAVIRKIREKVSKKLIAQLILAGLLGMILGLFILKQISINNLRITAGALSIIFTILIFFEKVKIHKSKYLFGVAGFVSGILQTSISMSGPPVVLLLTGINMPKNEFRKTLLTYFLTINIISIPLFAFSRSLSLDSFKFGFISAPAVILAGYIGHLISQKIPQDKFRMIALSAVFGTGLVAIISGFTS